LQRFIIRQTAKKSVAIAIGRADAKADTSRTNPIAIGSVSGYYPDSG